MKGIIYKHRQLGRTLFLSGNVLYIWYHYAWRYWQELPWKYARLINDDPSIVGGIKAETSRTVMNARLAFWFVDYSYHQIACSRVVYRIRHREYKIRNNI